jgi:hypothetical protein
MMQGSVVPGEVGFGLLITRHIDQVDLDGRGAVLGGDGGGHRKTQPPLASLRVRSNRGTL